MKRFFSFLVFVVLGVLTLNTTNLEAIDTYRHFELYFLEKDNYVELRVYNHNLDVVEMKLYRDNEFYLDLEVVEFKEYQLKNFLAGKIYEFYIFYRIKNDPNYYQSMLHTVETSKDIVSDFEDNDPIGLIVPDGVVTYRFLRQGLLEFSYVIPENLIGQTFQLNYDDLAFWLQYAIKNKYSDKYSIKNNTFEIPEIITKTINVSKKKVVFYTSNQLGAVSDYYVFISFDTPIDLIESITFEYVRIIPKYLGMFGKKIIHETKTITPEDRVEISSFGFVSRWEAIEKSPNPEYDWKIRFGTFVGGGKIEVKTIKITYKHLNILYEDIPVNDDFTPAEPADPDDPPITIDTQYKLRMKEFFENLFKIRNFSDFFNLIVKYFVEFIVSIIFLLLLPIFIKLFSILLDLVILIISIFIPRRVRGGN